MSHFFTTELGRMRTEEAIARADRYRLAQQAQQHNERTTVSRPARFAYRRALAAVGLSALVAIGTATAALAYPAGPGTSSGSDIVADRMHPQVKGVRVGIPVEADAVNTFAQAREGTVLGTDLALPRRAAHAFVPQGRDWTSTFAQARESVPGESLGSSLTFAQAREGTTPDRWSDVETFIASGYYVPQPVADDATFAQAREGTTPDRWSDVETFIASGYYVPQPVTDRAPYVALGSRLNADALEHMTGQPVAAVPSEGERFAGSGLYGDRDPYVALGNRHNADALDQMVEGPRDVADTGVQAPVEDAGISLTTIVAIASLLVLVGGGVMVAARDRNMPKPV
jgi:hypothetical protein